MVETPPPERLPHRLQCFRANPRQKGNDMLMPVPDRFSRPKAIAQKVERLVWVVATPVHILAIDELCLLRMQSQLAGRKPASKALLNARASRHFGNGRSCRRRISRTGWTDDAAPSTYRRHGESRRRVSPPRAPRTGRDTLASSGSRCPADVKKLPVRKELW